MLLCDVITNLESTDDSLCILAKRPWQPGSEALLVKLTVDHRVPREALSQGYEYFLEVSVALDDVIEGVGTVLSRDQRVDAVLYYAENDAFPDWLCALRDLESQ